MATKILWHDELRLEVADDVSAPLIVTGELRRWPGVSVDVVIIEKGEGNQPHHQRRAVIAEAVRNLIDEMNRIGGAHHE